MMQFNWLGKRVEVRRTAILGVGVALAVSALSVLAAASFSRAAPPSLAPPAGMKVGTHDVTLAPGAPQWSVIKLGKAEAPAPHWTEPFAARIRIDETQAARVGSPLSGHIRRVFAELGQRVKKGDPLFSVASPDIATLHSAAAKAAVDVDVARAQYDRVHDMVGARLVAGKEEITAKAEQQRAELELREARSKLASLNVAGKSDGEFTITAPRDGVVVEKNVLPAQEVSSDGTLFTIADVSKVWVVADVFEGDAAQLATGAQARITLPSVPGFSVEALVSSVSAVVDPERHSVPVRVELDNAAGALRPNQYADVRFAVKLPDSAVEIASSAIVSDGATQYVYVQEAPGRFARKRVEAGVVRDGKIAVHEGLSLGDVVVEQGGILLDNQIELSH